MKKTLIYPPTHPAPRGAYSPGLLVEHGGSRTLYLTGQLAVDPDGKVVAPYDAAAPANRRAVCRTSESSWPSREPTQKQSTPRKAIFVILYLNTGRWGRRCRLPTAERNCAGLSEKAGGAACPTGQKWYLSAN